MSNDQIDSVENSVSNSEIHEEYEALFLFDFFNRMVAELRSEIDQSAGFDIFSKKFHKKFVLHENILDENRELNSEIEGNILDWVQDYIDADPVVSKANLSDPVVRALFKSIINACAIHGLKIGLEITPFLEYSTMSGDTFIIDQMIKDVIAENRTFLEIDSEMADYLVSTLSGDPVPSAVRQELYDMLAANGVSTKLFLGDKYRWLKGIKEVLDGESKENETVREALALSSCQESETIGMLRTGLVLESFAQSKDTSTIKSLLHKLRENEKEALRQVMVSIAMADGMVKKPEITLLQNLYEEMGLNKSLVTSDVTDFAAQNALLNRIGNVDIGNSQLPIFDLDSEILALRESETESVKEVLGNVFDGESSKESPSVSINEVSSSTFVELDKAHQELLGVLITKEHWAHDEIAPLCRPLDLMLDGALETINDWSLDKIDAPLLEIDEAITVDLDKVSELIS